jgi:hypothetical protein
MKYYKLSMIVSTNNIVFPSEQSIFVEFEKYINNVENNLFKGNSCIVELVAEDYKETEEINTNNKEVKF